MHRQEASHELPKRPRSHPGKNPLATLFMKNTTQIIATHALWTRATGHFYALKRGIPAFLALLAPLLPPLASLAPLAPLVLTAVLTGCTALPDKPVRATVYDFGPGALATPSAQTALPANRIAPLPALAALALDEVQSSPALDSTAVLYRLAYADAQALRPYAQARWSMAPAQLLRQRLREHLGLRRAVLNAGEGSAPIAPPANAVAVAGGTSSATASAAAPLLLRVELEEFSQLFESPTASTGLLRLRATAVQASPQGEKLLGQRSFIVQRPAPSADAAGGVRALTAATDAVVEELDQWLQQIALIGR